MVQLESLQAAVERVQGLSAYATYKDKLTNTYGVVVESDAPRHTSGTDFIQTIRLVDESCPEGVALCIFARHVSEMPAAQLGDVLELHNVIVQFWQDRPQLFAKMAKPHTFGFVLYRPTSNNNAINNSGGSNQQLQQLQQAGGEAVQQQPVQVFNATPDASNAAQRLPQLQALGFGQASAADSACVYLRRIKDLAPPEQDGQRPPCVDMRVKVLAVDERRASEEVVMFVWDATDAKPVSASLQLPPSEWKGQQLTVPHPRRLVMPLVAEPPGLQVLQELPHIGTALPVVMLPEAVPSTGLPKVGDWVKIKVVGVAAVQGQWQVVFGKSSRLTQSQPSQGFEGWYNTRLANADTCEWPHDLSRVATACALPALPRSTIRQVLLRAADRQAGPFRVQLRLLGYLPQQLQQWCKTRPPPQQQQGDAGDDGAEPVWEWAAHLWLEDATGELRALLLGQEGTKLLGMPTQCLGSNAEAVQELGARLQHLTTVDDDGGVWMDVALTPLYASGQQQEQQQEQQLEQHQQPAPSGQEEGLVEVQQQQEQQQPDGGSQGQQQPQLQLALVDQPVPGSEQGQQLGPALPPQAQQPPVFVLHDAVMAAAALLQHEPQHEPQHEAQEQPRQPSPPAEQPPQEEEQLQPRRSTRAAATSAAAASPQGRPKRQRRGAATQ